MNTTNIKARIYAASSILSIGGLIVAMGAPVKWF